MTDWRNQIIHEYSEDAADELYARLPKILELFKVFAEKVAKE